MDSSVLKEKGILDNNGVLRGLNDRCEPGLGWVHLSALCYITLTHNDLDDLACVVANWAVLASATTGPYSFIHSGSDTF